jgi:hypothetical protein
MRDSELAGGDPPAGRIIKVLATDPAARRSIAGADVIIGIDRRAPAHGTLFFGRVVLERTARSGKEQDMHILEVRVDFETDDVEELIAACLV